MDLYEEMEDISVISSALVVNIGCIEKAQAAAMEIAASIAFRTGKPWVLDPVGAGASRYRTEAALSLAKRFRPSVIRGNASEIIALSRALEDVAADGTEVVSIANGTPMMHPVTATGLSMKMPSRSLSPSLFRMPAC